jgi:sec-independent protein translocase protein TatA
MPSLTPVFAIFGLGPTELIIVGLVVLLLFGSRLPKVMRSLGEGIVEFKRGVQGIEDTGSGTPREPGATDVR